MNSLKLGDIAFQNSPNPIALFDLKLRAIKLNSAFHEMINFDLTDKAAVLFHMLDSFDLDIIYESILENSSFKGVVTLSEKFNNAQCEIVGHLEEEESEKVILLFITDITENRNLKRSISILENRFQLVFRNAPEAIAIVETSTGMFVDYNTFFLKLTRLYDDDIEQLTYKQILVEESRLTTTQSNLNLDYEVYTYEEKFVTKRAGIIDVEITETDIFYNNMECKLLFIRDITERKLIEEEVRTSKNRAVEMAELLNKYSLELESKNGELEKQKSKAEKLSKVKSDFLANMSHEIRTPLNAIISFTKLLRETKLTPTQTEFIKDIDTGSNSLLNLINSVLDYSKIEAGRMEIELIDTNIREIIEEVADLISVKYESKDLEVISIIDVEVPNLIISDPTRLRQILINLVNNGAKFTSEGTVVIRASVDNQKFTLSVKDTGIGIKESDIGKLFKDFSQVDISTTRRFGGSGLGLAITKQLVELLGGNISVESVYGEGSNFIVEMDLKLSCNNINFDSTELKGRTIAFFTDNDALVEKCDIFAKSYQLVIDRYSTSHYLEFSDSNSYERVIVDYESYLRSELNIADQLLKERDVYLTVKNSNYLKLSSGGFPSERLIKKPVKIDQFINLFNKDNFTAETTEVVEKRKSSFKGKILVVDDVDLNRKIVDKILRKMGVEVLFAKDGLEATKLVSNDLSLIFMDCLMPVMDGYEASKKIREMGYSSHILPIVALTANSSEEQYLKVLDAGMDDFLEKPIDFEKMKLVLDKYLEKGRGEFKVDHYFKSDQLLDRVDGDKEFVKEIIGDFIETLDMRDKPKVGDSKEEMLDKIHAIKGIALGVGAFKLSEAIAEFEKRSNDGSLFDKQSFDSILTCIESYTYLKGKDYEL